MLSRSHPGLVCSTLPALLENTCMTGVVQPHHLGLNYQSQRAQQQHNHGQKQGWEEVASSVHYAVCFPDEMRFVTLLMRT